MDACCVWREREKVNWCFTPSQPVRLYQGDRGTDRQRESIIHAWISLRGYQYVQLYTSIDRESFLKFPKTFRVSGKREVGGKTREQVMWRTN